MQNNNPAATAEESQPRKLGEAVRFINGKYEGKQGWFDLLKGATRTRYYVFVDMGGGALKATFVSKGNVVVIAEERAPTSFEEAVLQTHTDVDKAMNKLVALFAQCGIRSDSTEVGRILSAKMVVATVAHNMQGNKATFRCTPTWPPRHDDADDDY